ncbi:MAG: hypothetical protein AB7P37_10240 [Ramlibacter sp.]
MLNDLAAWASVLALLAAVIPLTFSARRYLTVRSEELRKDRFDAYHRILRIASAGSDERGVLKLVSQVAFIYELRNFPEYADLTETVLEMLREEWARGEDAERRRKLHAMIDDTLAHLQRRT